MGIYCAAIDYSGHLAAQREISVVRDTAEEHTGAERTGRLDFIVRG
jgi:hypothetical protein